MGAFLNRTATSTSPDRLLAREMQDLLHKGQTSDGYELVLVPRWIKIANKRRRVFDSAEDIYKDVNPGVLSRDELDVVLEAETDIVPFQCKCNPHANLSDVVHPRVDISCDTYSRLSLPANNAAPGFAPNSTDLLQSFAALEKETRNTTPGFDNDNHE
jgi:hypothetical protein